MLKVSKEKIVYGYILTPSPFFIRDDYSPEQIEDLLLDKLGCNLNDSPLNTFISVLSVNHYGKHLRYLQELKDRMMEINYAKWNGNYQLVRPSTIATKQHKVQRDEL